MYHLPEGTHKYGDSPDSVTFVRPGHTAAVPRLLIVNRVTNPGSIPTYRVRAIDGHKDENDIPVPERTVVDVTIRRPGFADVTQAKNLLTYVSEVLGDAEFQDDALVDFMFPREFVPE